MELLLCGGKCACLFQSELQRALGVMLHPCAEMGLDCSNGCKHLKWSGVVGGRCLAAPEVTNVSNVGRFAR